MPPISGQGFFVIHRELFDKPIWLNSTPEQIKVLILIIGLANHTGKQWEWDGKKFTCERGQFITSLPKLVDQCGKGVTTQNVRTALKRFEKLGFLTDKSTAQGRMITICNYSEYQDIKEEDNKQTNRQLTGDQQTPNRHLTPTNNVNNVNNETNIPKPPKKPATTKTILNSELTLSDEWKKLAEDYWSEKKRNDLSATEEFFKFKNNHIAKGSKMADWKRAWANWYSNAVTFNKPSFQIISSQQPQYQANFQNNARQMPKAGSEQ